MILCCGEALIDMLPAETADGRAGFVPVPGGAVFNTAIALARLGVRAGLLSGLSSDGFGQLLRETLHAEGVDTALSIVTDRKTALAFVFLSDAQAHYSFHDEGSAMRLLGIDQIPALPDHVRALFFGGISLACEPCGRALEALHARAGDGRVTMLDPNVRPAFVRDEAAYRARLGRMMGQSDIVKCSDEDLAWLVPEAPTLESRMASILDLGPALVVVTRGREGALARSVSGVAVSVPAKAVRVVDTVGAGDTFNAGLLAKLRECGALERGCLRALDRDVLTAALHHGVAAAAFAVTKAGAHSPRAEELAQGNFERG